MQVCRTERDAFGAVPRNQGVRVVLLASFLAVAALSTAASPAADAHLLRGGHLAVVAPRSWHLTHARLTDCVSPRQVFAVTDATRIHIDAKLPGDRTLVLLLESPGGRAFPARSEIRVPDRLDQMGGCCEMPLSRGFSVAFRDHGRNFYAFVYAAKRSNAARAASLLNTLRVS
jgi:hypothetical protein